MNRTTATILLLLLLAGTIASAQPTTEVRKSETSGIEFFTTNYGIFGSNVARGAGGLFYPRGSGLQYIFGSGLWFGARKTVDDSMTALSFITYNPNSGNSWAAPGGWTTDPRRPSTFTDLIAYSPEYNRTTGAWSLNSAPRPGWALWNRGATPTLGDPGTYVADSASRTMAISGTPAFVPGVSEQYVSRYHDGDTSRYEGETQRGLPIGLQIEQNVYGFAQTGFENIVILHYRIINVSADTLYDCFASQAMDPDLGNGTNDFASYYTPRPGLATGYVYSSNNLGDATRFGALVQTLLESPAMETFREPNRINFIRHDKHVYDSSEQVGLATFMNWTIDIDAKSPAERYQFMASRTLSTHVPGSDVRTLLSAGPFNMRPGDTARFAIGFTILPDLHIPPTGASGAQPQIEAAAEKVLAMYRAMPVSTVRESRREESSLTIGALHPNSARDRATLELRLADRAMVRVELIDMLGRVMRSRESGMLETGDHSVALDLAGVTAGSYVVTIEADGVRQSRRLIVAN